MDSQQAELQGSNETMIAVLQKKVRRKFSLKRFLLRLSGLYVILLILLLSFETYLVYPGIMFKLDKAWTEATFAHEVVEFESEDGTKLVGWYLPCENADHTALLCHGNGEDAAKTSSYVGLMLREHLNARVFVFDYRGFGKSEGSPFERGVLEDSEAAMKWLNQKTGTKPADVMLVGHSIGGGPAVHIASTMGCKVLILQRTFDSLVEAAKGRYWFVPVDYLMRNRYPSGEKIKNCEMPLFQSHGTQDTVVPYKSGRRLFEASPAKTKQFFDFDGGNHFTFYSGAYWNELQRFLKTNVESENK